MERVAYLRLLHPLLVPSGVLSDITMELWKDFQNHGIYTILVIVYRFFKYSHFTALTHPFTAKTIAEMLLNHFDKFHRLLASIVTSRDKVF
jgi:hypothetical protein